ncbi:MAG: hypothetical protein ACXADW_15040 [Candidatus Hodarchaeales archaeon]
MEDIKALIIKAKALKQSKQVTEAISLLNKAHDIGISTNDVENLVDIHNQLMLLHYQNNDPESFQKSFKFAGSKLIIRISLKRLRTLHKL